MVLGFKQQFVSKILNGTKIHTIREDKNERWRQGRLINFATGVRTKNYSQFKIGECKNVQYIDIQHHEYFGKRVFILTPKDDLFSKQLSDKEIETLAYNDGFDSVEDFFSWFDTDFSGYIIHWTDYIYM